jgi:hypothetical protein
LVVNDSDYNELERVKVSRSDEGKIKREELRRKWNPKEVIFIFEKKLD